MYKRSETEIAIIEKLPGNIFNVTVKHGAEVDLESARRLILVTNQMMEPGLELRGGIYDLTQITYINDEARNYFADGTEIKGQVVGVAIISSSFLGKVMGNMFITINPPRKYRVKFFDSPIRAEHWVRQQMTIARKAKEGTEHLQNVA